MRPVYSSKNLRPGQVSSWKHPFHESRKCGKRRSTYRRLYYQLFPEMVDDSTDIHPPKLTAVELVTIDRILSGIVENLVRMRIVGLGQTKTARHKKKEASGESKRTTQRNVAFVRAGNGTLAGGLESTSNFLHFTPTLIETIRRRQHERFIALIDDVIFAIFGDVESMEHAQKTAEHLWEEMEMELHEAPDQTV